MADFRTLRDRIIEALSEYDYDLRSESDKTQELKDTITRLMIQKTDLEEKVMEMARTIEKLKVKDDITNRPVSEEEASHSRVNGEYKWVQSQSIAK